MDQLTDLETRAAALKSEITTHRQRFRTRTISPALKRAAITLCDEATAIGMWPYHAAQLIGSQPGTIEKWRSELTHPDPVPAHPDPTHLLPVRIIDDPTHRLPSLPTPTPTLTPTPTPTLTLITPAGWRIEGIPLAHLAALIPTLP